LISVIKNPDEILRDISAGHLFPGKAAVCTQSIFVMRETLRGVYSDDLSVFPAVAP